MFTHICEICGNTFESPSNRAKYCTDCRNKAQKLRNDKYKAKRREGLSVEIGSEQLCPFCGKPYIVVTGSQKCCEDCRKVQEKQRKIQANKKFNKEHYKRFTINVTNADHDAIKAYAESQGMSVNKLFLTALEEYKKAHE